jgi:hypothetical protein
MMLKSSLSLLFFLLYVAFAEEHSHGVHGQDFSAKRLNDLSAKWGIDVWRLV